MGEKFELKLNDLVKENNQLVERLTNLEKEKNMYYYHIRSIDYDQENEESGLCERNLNINAESKFTERESFKKPSLIENYEKTFRKKHYDSRLQKRIEEVRDENKKLKQALRLH